MKETITKAFRSEPYGRYQQGTSFTKGDYIPSIRNYYARTSSGRMIELDPDKIRKVSNQKRITENILDKLVGVLVELLEK